MCANHYENPTMLSKVTAKNVGDIFETHCRKVAISDALPLEALGFNYELSSQLMLRWPMRCTRGIFAFEWR